MTTVRFVSTPKDDSKPYNVRDEHFETKKLALVAIHKAGAKPGKKLGDGTRIAVLQ